jgi:predicted nuclease with TOPRIM domain
MKYELEQISTVQACDALLAGAKKKKQNLERRVRNLGESLHMFRERIAQVHSESAQVQSMLETFTDAYGSLAEGPDKVNMKIRIKRLELQQAMLEKKAATYHVGALLIKEMQYNRLASQVSVLEDYITAVAQRGAAVEVPTLRIVQPAVLLRQSVARPELIPPALLRPEISTEERASFFRSHFRTGPAHHFNVAQAG